ncbi:MAG: purine/pyrimidine permease [Gammaproteobacteria bacterium]|jgi:NCS2 family nucleobase:cation symporter-2/xanthine permease XanP|nr:purine/pyrimidine permease [Gammaproteobacteria bacterium]
MTQDTLQPQLLYELDDKPPVMGAAFVGFQHLLAIIGGILTAPFLIALGMGLNAEDSAYVISSALVVSGFATLIQINRMGMLGAGLLSIQGTSFAFIGIMIFAYQKLTLNMTSFEALGAIFGSSAACAALMLVLSLFIRQLKNIITTNVAGATIILIGLSLIQSTLQNLLGSFNAAGGLEGSGISHLALAAVVFAVIVVIASLRQVWLRLSSITIGLGFGILAALQMGIADFSGVTNGDIFFIPEFGRYPLTVDLQVMLLIMPIFLVSAMESIGDITATNNLSGLQTGTPDYWLRIRGGIMGTAFNSFIAALFCTFPSTTFSQNNGVIRLTGVCSRQVGNYVAGFLIILGCLPVVTAVFQRIPSEVIFGATLLMFMLVALSGFRVVEMAQPKFRDWTIVALAIVLGYVISMFIDRVPNLSPEIVILFQFPVSTGALVALLLEFVIPSGDADASD